MAFGKKGAKKKKGSEQESSSSLRMITIPDIFYGGADPEIYHAHHAKRAKEHVAKGVAPPKKQMEPQLQTERKKPTTPTAPKRSFKKMIIFSSIVVFLIFIGGVSWYYYQQEFGNQNTGLGTGAPPSAPNTGEQNIQTPTTPTGTSQIATSTPTTTPENTQETTYRISDFPAIITVDGADLDADGLTDKEEEVFGTDPGIWDTDNDGYYDGQELMNLYSPTDEAPALLSDAGSVLEYIHPVRQYRLYYPAAWQQAAVGINSDNVLFSSIDGDYIELSTYQKEDGQTFTAWFGAHVDGQFFTDLAQETNRFGIDYYVRRDGLVAYVDYQDVVYVMIYHPSEATRISYRAIMAMAFQGFRPVEVVTQIPEQEILPGFEESSVITTSSTPL